MPAIPFWVQLLKIPYSILIAMSMVFMVIGSYSSSNSMFDVGTLIFFGDIGYISVKLTFRSRPLR